MLLCIAQERVAKLYASTNKTLLNACKGSRSATFNELLSVFQRLNPEAQDFE